MLPAQESRVSWKRILPVIAVAVACLAGLVALDLTGPFAYVRARNLLRDAIARAGRTTPPNPDLVFLAIDSASVSLEEQGDVEEMYRRSDGNDSTRGARVAPDEQALPVAARSLRASCSSGSSKPARKS